MAETKMLRYEDGRFAGKYLSCDWCEMTIKHGLYGPYAAHETSCSHKWSTEERECRECGFQFIPEDKDQLFCSPCCASSYGGYRCDCDHCVQIWREDHTERCAFCEDNFVQEEPDRIYCGSSCEYLAQQEG